MTKREKIQGAAAALLALTGAVLMTVRPWGMRFSGFLLAGLAAVLVIALLLDRWAAASKTGRLCRRVFQTALPLVLVPLLLIEVYVINAGCSDLSALPADAVVVLGAGVNGTQPSLSLYTRLTAALAIWRKTRTSRWCSPADGATARRSPRPNACTTGSLPGAWTRRG